MSTPRDPHTGRFLCVPTYPRLRTSTCGCGGGGAHPCPVGKRLGPVREAARRAYKPPRYTQGDVEELERDLYGIEAERGALDEELGYVNAQLKAVGGSGERGMRGRSTQAQARHVQELRNRNQSLGKGYTARDAWGEASEGGYAQLLQRKADLLAHRQHLRGEERSLTSLRRAVVRAVERGGRMAPVERQALGLARRRWHARRAAPRRR